MASSSERRVATAWLSNQAVIYGIVAVIVIALVLLVIHYGRIWFSGLIDKLMGFVQGFVPKPKTQDPGRRGLTDDITGLAYANEGDRALDDLVTIGEDGYVTSGQAAAELKNSDYLQSNGYIDANLNWTPKGNAWRASLEQTTF